MTRPSLSPGITLHRLIIVALLSGAFFTPTAVARDTPGAWTTGAASAAIWRASPREIDRLGPKYVPLQHHTALTILNTTKLEAQRFDWSAAVIGGVAASLALGLLAALVVLASRPRRKPAPPERARVPGAS